MKYKNEMCLELSEMARTLINTFKFCFAPHDDDVDDDVEDDNIEDDIFLADGAFAPFHNGLLLLLIKNTPQKIKRHKKNKIITKSQYITDLWSK